MLYVTLSKPYFSPFIDSIVFSNIFGGFHFSLLGSISTTCLSAAFTLADPKSTKSCLSWLSFLRFWYLHALKLLLNCWWNWPLILQYILLLLLFMVDWSSKLKYETRKTTHRHAVELSCLNISGNSKFRDFNTYLCWGWYIILCIVR